MFLSVRLSYYVDCLDKKTNLSGAFIGGHACGCDLSA